MRKWKIEYQGLIMTDIGRNDPCHCGSGKKYKKCHLEKDEKANARKRQKASLNSAKMAKKSDDNKQPNWKPDQAGKSSWFKKITQSFKRAPTSRKSP